MPGGMSPIPAVLMKIPSAPPRLTTFVSPVAICTPASEAVFCMDPTIFFRSETEKPSSMINPALKKERPGPAHGEVVHCPTDGQLPDIAPGEKDRGYHVAVRGESPPSPGNRNHCRVIKGMENRVIECSGKDRSYQLMAELPPLPWASKIRSEDGSFLASWFMNRIYRQRRKILRRRPCMGPQGSGECKPWQIDCIPEGGAHPGEHPRSGTPGSLLRAGSSDQKPGRHRNRLNSFRKASPVPGINPRPRHSTSDGSKARAMTSWALGFPSGFTPRRY